MQTKLLDETAFNDTFAFPMQNVTALDTETIDIWPYVDAIPVRDLRGLKPGNVRHVYRNATSTFEHVLILTGETDTFLVIVVSLLRNRVHGHHLLQLVEKYGLTRSAP